MPKLAELANETTPWETDPENGEQFISIADVCGGFWWAQLHSWAENIRDHGCSDCGEFAVSMALAMHDLVNVKLLKPPQHPELLAQFGEFFQIAAEDQGLRGVKVAQPAQPELCETATQDRALAASFFLEPDAAMMVESD